jgi:uncharacterized membrane protein
MLVYVPEDEVIQLDMPVEDAVKLVMSGGALVQQVSEEERARRLAEQQSPGQI